MRRADQFIELYNQLVDHLLTLTGENSHTRFYPLLDKAIERSPIVRREVARLRKYGDLRNAIVHDKAYPQEVIAEPTEETIARFRELVEHIISPKRLESYQKQLRIFSSDEPLINALTYMRDNDFSQIIVQKSEQIALLTVEGITRWLEEQAAQELRAQELVLVTEATVGQALEYDLPENYRLMSRKQTVEDALNAFTNSIEQGRPRLYAIIVTHNGKRSEGPLGIITPWDLIEYSRR